MFSEKPLVNVHPFLIGMIRIFASLSIMSKEEEQRSHDYMMIVNYHYQYVASQLFGKTTGFPRLKKIIFSTWVNEQCERD